MNSRRRLSTAFAMRSSSPGNTDSPSLSSKVSIATTLAGNNCSSTGEYLLRCNWGARAFTPLIGVAERNLLETYTVVLRCAGNMQVTVNHEFGPEAFVPIRSSVGSTPLRKCGEAQHLRRLTDQRPVANEHRFHVRTEPRKATFGFL